jgi:hypothetical protein
MDFRPPSGLASTCSSRYRKWKRTGTEAREARETGTRAATRHHVGPRRACAITGASSLPQSRFHIDTGLSNLADFVVFHLVFSIFSRKWGTQGHTYIGGTTEGIIGDIPAKHEYEYTSATIPYKPELNGFDKWNQE